MAAQSSIEWTDASWNPTVGCSIVSPGCTNCYAMKVAHGLERRFNSPKYFGLTKVVNGNAVWTGEVRLDETALLQPLKWKKPRRIFVNSMSDLFHESLPDEAIDKVFAVMALCPQHTFQVLTKRADRMREYLTKPHHPGKFITIADDGTKADTPSAHIRAQSAMCELMPVAPAQALNAAAAWQDKHYPDGDGFMRKWPLPNLWLGISAERQQEWDERIPLLLQTPAAVRFVSAEPLLGPIVLAKAIFPWALDEVRKRCEGKESNPRDGKIDWVIVGGESGPKARPMNPDWARCLRDQCLSAGVPYFFKQHGEFLDYVRVGKKAAGRLLDGIEHSAFPPSRSSV